MNYKSIRPLIKSGDVIGLSHTGLGSKIVCIATQSEYSHVGVAWVTSGRVMLLEAVIPRVRIFPLSKHVPFVHLPMGETLSDDAEEFAMSKIGERYSIMEACKGLFGLTRADSKWQCAEYAKAVLTANGHQLSKEATPEALISEGLAINGGIIHHITNE